MVRSVLFFIKFEQLPEHGRDLSRAGPRMTSLSHRKTIHYIGIAVSKATLHINASDLRSSTCSNRAKARGQRAKTDRIDAALITDYARHFPPTPTPPMSATRARALELRRGRQAVIACAAKLLAYLNSRFKKLERIPT